MNKRQLISMWCGIIIVFFIAFFTVIEPYSPDYEIFCFWLFLMIIVISGFMCTFKGKGENLRNPNDTQTQTEKDRSKEMNLRKGFKRLVFILSLIPALIGIIVFIVGLVDEDDGMLIGGLLTALIGFITIWAIYGVVLFIIKGFNSHHCENCEKNIGKLEEEFKFNEHVVCAECYKKLNENQKDEIS